MAPKNFPALQERSFLPNGRKGTDEKEVFSNSAGVRGVQCQPKWKEENTGEKVKVDWGLNPYKVICTFTNLHSKTGFDKHDPLRTTCHKERVTQEVINFISS